MTSLSTGAKQQKSAATHSSHNHSPPPAPRSRGNGTLDRFVASYKALPPDERKAQEARRSTKLRERLDEMQKAEQAAKKRKEERKREQGRERVKRHRERKRQEKALEGNHQVSKRAGKRAKQELLGAERPVRTINDAAALSRPDAKWDAHRNGTKRGVVPKKRERRNYFHPFLWCHIDRVARQCNYSATLTVKILSRDMPELYGKLSKSTVHGWLSRHGRRWSTRTMKNVEMQRALPGKGRVAFLAKYPEIVDKVKTQLIGLRKTGISVNRVLV